MDKMGKKPGEGKSEWGPLWGGKPPSKPKPKPKPEPPHEAEWYPEHEYPDNLPEWKPKPTEKPEPEPEPEKEEEEEKYPDHEPEWKLPITLPTAEWFKCPKKMDGGYDFKDSHIQNSKNCRTFIQCVPNGKNKRNMPVVMHCPDGFLWNDHDKDCDYPEFATCNMYGKVEPMSLGENASVSSNPGTNENSGKVENSSTDKNPGTADNNPNDFANLENVSAIFQ